MLFEAAATGDDPVAAAYQAVANYAKLSLKK
jgi:hypothetical protein